MAHLIDKSALVAEIENLLDKGKYYDDYDCAFRDGNNAAIYALKGHINTLEVKGVDLEKLGEIARHLIAVKEHIEDMRLDKEEWFMLEKIGYPERFKAQKGE